MKKTLEVKCTEKFEQLRSKIAAPFLKLIVKTHITPNSISYAGVACMVLFVWFIRNDPWVAFAFLLISAFLDGILDGALARYLKTDCDKGKFIDQICDITAFMLFVAGATSIYLIKPVPAILFMYFMVLSKFFAVIKKNLGKKTDWIIRPFVGFFANLLLYLTYGVFLVWLFFGINYMNETVYVFTAALIVKSILDFRVIISEKL